MKEYNRQWIIDNGVPIVQDYSGDITLRALHYRLVALGMTNTIQQYKGVVGAMTKARWDGLLDFNDFTDLERSMVGSTDYEPTDLDDEVATGIRQIKAWMSSYSKNRWENQPNYVEVWVEKKALQGTLTPPCQDASVGLFACKGYPSLTWIDKAKDRFEDAESAEKEVHVIYLGDYDCSGDDIPRSIIENLNNMGFAIDDDRFHKHALTEEQVIKWKLPPAPTKQTDSRARNWDGIGQVELDAVEPNKLQELAEGWIADLFDESLHEELMKQEEKEAEEYMKKVKEWVADYDKDDDEGDD